MFEAKGLSEFSVRNPDGRWTGRFAGRTTDGLGYYQGHSFPIEQARCDSLRRCLGTAAIAGERARDIGFCHAAGGLPALDWRRGAHQHGVARRPCFLVVGRARGEELHRRMAR